MNKYNKEIIDAHHHLWDLSLNKHRWLIDDIEAGHLGDYSAIRQSYLVADFLNDSKNFFIKKSVHIQAGWDRSDPLGESVWLDQLADKTKYPTAMVCYADLTDPNIEVLLEQLAVKPRVRGIRQILSWHENSYYRGCEKDYLQIDAWRKNFYLLKKYGLSFDMQIYPEQVDDAYSLLSTFDDIPVVIDHALMPMHRDASYLAYWRMQLKKLSTLPQVRMKISGLAMFDHNWNAQSFRQIILPVVEEFSSARCMIGSNFPVDKLYGAYDKMMSAYVDIISTFSDSEQTDIFYRVAEEFYRI